MKYKTEEERREAHRLRQKRYKERHLEEYLAKHRENQKRWMDKHPEKASEIAKNYQVKYLSTMLGRAGNLFAGYKKADRKHGRETTITREWIVDHVFSSSCVYCGESDWRKLGCDRKDNSIGHTPENCIPACSECNSAKARYPFHQYIGSLWSIQGRLRQQGSAQTRLVSVPRSVRIALGAFDQSSQDR